MFDYAVEVFGGAVERVLHVQISFAFAGAEVDSETDGGARVRSVYHGSPIFTTTRPPNPAAVM